MAGLGLATAAALAVSGIAAVPAVAQGTIVGADSPNAIKGSYIVVYRDAAAQGLTSRLAGKHHAAVRYTYSTALRGFAGTMSDSQARQLAADPSVAYVEQDQTVTVDATQTPTPSWGLDRIDQRDLPLNNSYTYSTTASNVHAYIIDTGIRTTHSDFGGRATFDFNSADTNNTDCNGHGTHVAGTTAGASFGVAKGARLHAVKVLNCAGSGSTAGVIAGIDWVTANHQSPAVANMSLGGSRSNPLDQAVQRSIASGVTYAIAAGNSNANACNASPARTPEAITVAATDITDARASFSNFGRCVDIFAPGVSITSAWNTNDTATNTISGTSMATPHVTGAAALYLATHAGATPAAVAAALVAAATPNKVTNPGRNSPNRLLYTGA